VALFVFGYTSRTSYWFLCDAPSELLFPFLRPCANSSKLHTVSSLSQAETANIQGRTAVSQGDDLKTLTQMTVVGSSFAIVISFMCNMSNTPANHMIQYVAFPLLFTTAFFSMDFATPPSPWAVFISVLFMTSLANYMIASQSSPSMVYNDACYVGRSVWVWIRNLNPEFWATFKAWSTRIYEEFMVAVGMMILGLIRRVS
jgi:hypothetical protein